MELNVIKELKEEITYKSGNLFSLSTEQKRLVQAYRKAKQAMALAIKKEKDPDVKKALHSEYDSITREVFPLEEPNIKEKAKKVGYKV